VAKTLIVQIQHRIGEEAIRRIQNGIAGLPATGLGKIFAVEDQRWTVSTLQFRARSMGQTCDGEILVADDHAQLTLPLKWYIAPFAGQIEAAVHKYGVELFRTSS
jgi:hypothetical protein